MSRLLARVHVGGGDRGITVAETLIYSALLVLVLPLAGALLHGAVLASRDVQSVTAASGSAQVLAASVAAGVRNASAASLTPYPNAAPLPPHQMLLVRTRTGTADAPRWACQAWYYDASLKNVRTRLVLPGQPGEAIAPPETATTPGWIELAAGVTTTGRPGAPAGVVPPLFTSTASAVQIGASIAAGTRKPVVLSTSITMRPQGETVSTPCF